MSLWRAGICRKHPRSTDRQKISNQWGEWDMFPYLLPFLWHSFGSLKEKGFLAACLSGELWKDKQKEEEEHIKFHIFLPHGQWEYDLFIKDQNKGSIKTEQIHGNIIFKDWTEKKEMNYYDSELSIQSFKHQCAYFQSSSCFNSNVILSLDE